MDGTASVGNASTSSNLKSNKQSCRKGWLSKGGAGCKDKDAAGEEGYKDAAREEGYKDAAGEEGYIQEALKDFRKIIFLGATWIDTYYKMQHEMDAKAQFWQIESWQETITCGVKTFI